VDHAALQLYTLLSSIVTTVCRTTPLTPYIVPFTRCYYPPRCTTPPHLPHTDYHLYRITARLVLLFTLVGVYWLLFIFARSVVRRRFNRATYYRVAFDTLLRFAFVLLPGTTRFFYHMTYPFRSDVSVRSGRFTRRFTLQLVRYRFATRCRSTRFFRYAARCPITICAAPRGSVPHGYYVVDTPCVRFTHYTTPVVVYYSITTTLLFLHYTTFRGSQRFHTF